MTSNSENLNESLHNELNSLRDQVIIAEKARRDVRISTTAFTATAIFLALIALAVSPVFLLFMLPLAGGAYMKAPVIVDWLSTRNNQPELEQAS